MKYNNIYNYIVLIVLMMSCDIIREPYLEEAPSVNDKLRKVLLEEFTGHLCPNCPAGAATAERLKKLYGEKLVLISYHSGFYARTTASFPTDYRTPAGDELSSFFNVQYFPSGMINRSVSAKTQLLGPVDWSEAIASQIAKKPDISLQISAQFIGEEGKYRADVTIKLLSPAVSPLNLCVYLTEDSLISPQSTNNDPLHPSGFIPEYTHQQVFRKSLNGTWGEPVFEKGAAALTQKTLSYGFISDKKYVTANCRLVAFVIHREDKIVLQVESSGHLP